MPSVHFQIQHLSVHATLYAVQFVHDLPTILTGSGAFENYDSIGMLCNMQVLSRTNDWIESLCIENSMLLSYQIFPLSRFAVSISSPAARDENSKSKFILVATFDKTKTDSSVETNGRAGHV